MKESEKLNDTPSLNKESMNGNSTVIPIVKLPKIESVPNLSKDAALEILGSKEVFYRGAYVTRIPLHGSDILIGRRDVMTGHYPDVDLAMYRAEDPAISRRHLRIYHDMNGDWFAEDLANRNSTFFNDSKEPSNHERHALKDGDVIRIASSISIKFKQG